MGHVEGSREGSRGGVTWRGHVEGHVNGSRGGVT